MSSVEVRESRNLREVDEAYELASKIFGPGYFEAKAMKAHIRQLEPVNDVRDVLIAVSDSKVVGLVRIVDRALYSPIGLLKVGGITSVCIHPDLRGQGWGIKIMEESICRSMRRKDVFSVLFARRAVDGWYPKLGYVGIGCHVELHVDKIEVDKSAFKGEIRAGIARESLSAYAAAYSDSYQNLFLSFFRDAAWWEKLDQRLVGKVASSDFFTVISDGALIGYFALQSGRIVEAASLHKHQREFLSGMIHWAVERNAKLILTLPLEHWCAVFFRRFNHVWSVRYSWDGGHMARVVNMEKVEAMLNSTRFMQDGQHYVSAASGDTGPDDHMSAKQAMLTLVGALPASLPGDGGRLNLPKNSRMLASPTWSIVDEF